MKVLNSSSINYYTFLNHVHYHLQTNILFLKYLMMLSLGNYDLINESLLMEEELDNCICVVALI